MKMWGKLGRPDLSGIRGSGPTGVGKGARWITVMDVLRHSFSQMQSVDTAVWDRNTDSGVLTPSTSPLEEERSISLWEHQLEAVKACETSKGVFRSGILDMDCGTGKTYVGVDLIRRSRAVAVVVTQHSLSVSQWVKDLTEVGGMVNVVTAEEAKAWNALSESFPNVLVLTYAALSRSLGCMDHDMADVKTSLLITWMARVLRFGMLVLDEVHLAAADHFKLACSLRASCMIGLTGSWVREDQRLDGLLNLIGPLLYRHRSLRTIQYSVIGVEVADSVREMLNTKKRREKEEHAVRTLNPFKIRALREVACDESIRTCRIAFFCDSAEAAPFVAESMDGVDGRPCVGVTDGRTPKHVRDDVVNAFKLTPRAILVSTKVCNTSVNFPEDCIVVMIHSSSGSRQQEVQSCGRGTRGEVLHSRVFHVVNVGTEEEGFVKRRLSHMKLLYGDRLTVSNTFVSASEPPCESETVPLSRYNERKGAPKRPRQNRESSIRRLRRIIDDGNPRRAKSNVEAEVEG